MRNILLALLLVFRHGVSAQGLVLFGRGTYPGDDSTYSAIRASGFSTFLLSSFYIKSNGDVVSGDDGQHPIIHEGQFTGSGEWLKRVQSLKGAGSSIRRVEILLEGRWYGQPPNTYDFIKDWADGAQRSRLEVMLKIFKEKIGVDAICIDDESVYDAHSIIQLGKMAQAAGLHMSLCPYTKIPYWKQIMDSSSLSVVDAVYLQCYDGGKDNTLAPWAAGLEGKLPVWPIFLCRGAFSTCGVDHNSKSPDEILAQMRAFKKEYPGLSGAGIWQMQDVKSYVDMRCAVKDPASGTAKSVPEYLEQLKKSLTDVDR